MARVVGIDWATEPKNRAMVVLDVPRPRGGIRVAGVAGRVDDAMAVSACRNPEHAVVAVDIPFGWPSEFALFVSRWQPTAGGIAPPVSELFRLRRTDRIVKNEVPKAPLSVSSDRIAIGARAWVSLLAAQALWKFIDVEGRLHADRPTLIEVYPGASAVALGRDCIGDVDEESYKSNASTRRRLIRHVASHTSVDLGGFEDAIVGQGKYSDHADAFLAAVTAAIYLRDQEDHRDGGAWRIRRPRNADEIASARVEGWIFFPLRES